MAHHSHIYLGPYIACVREASYHEVEAIGCTNPFCSAYPTAPQHNPGIFCKYCGAAVGKVMVRVLDDPYPYDLLQDTLTVLNPQETGIKTSRHFLLLAPNERRVGCMRRVHYDAEADIDVLVALSGADIEAEIRWFEEAYASALEKLRGVSLSIAVKWGMHIYLL